MQNHTAKTEAGYEGVKSMTWMISCYSEKKKLQKNHLTGEKLRNLRESQHEHQTLSVHSAYTLTVTIQSTMQQFELRIQGG